jgi:hypothetical protein
VACEVIGETIYVDTRVYSRYILFDEANDYDYDLKWHPANAADFASVDGSGKFDPWDLDADTEVRFAVLHGVHQLIQYFIGPCDFHRCECGTYAQAQQGAVGLQRRSTCYLAGGSEAGDTNIDDPFVGGVACGVACCAACSAVKSISNSYITL